MTGISPLNKIVEYGIKTPVNAINKLPFVKKSCLEYQKDNLKYIGNLAVASIVLKDGLGCIMYVKQSLSNDKIPEDKRKFVAALDMTNGGLMILSQILMYKFTSSKKIQSAMFEKMLGKFFNSKAVLKYKDAIKTKPQFANLNDKKFDAVFGNFKKDVQNFLGIFTSLVASTILAKRVIVPFLATPLADKVKAGLDKKEQNKTEKKD